MKTVDVTFQNLDSSEISLTDVSHDPLPATVFPGVPVHPFRAMSI